MISILLVQCGGARVAAASEAARQRLRRHVRLQRVGVGAHLHLGARDRVDEALDEGVDLLVKAPRAHIDGLAALSGSFALRFLPSTGDLSGMASVRALLTAVLCSSSSSESES